MSPRRNSSPHLAAARRGGDSNQAMDGEGDPSIGTPMEVAYWLQVYTEILAMEEKVLLRAHDLMATQSPAARREVELTNLPVIESQVERFRERLGYWRARRIELDKAGRQEQPKADERPDDRTGKAPRRCRPLGKFRRQLRSLSPSRLRTSLVISRSHQ